jgi:hypothetical protein
MASILRRGCRYPAPASTQFQAEGCDKWMHFDLQMGETPIYTEPSSGPHPEDSSPGARLAAQETSDEQ